MERSDPVIVTQVDKFDDYQKAAMQYRLPNSSPEYAVLGLLEEAGEVAGVFAKLVRGDYSPDVAVTKLRKELGDILWMVAAVASDNGWSMSELGADNLDKLESRKLRSVLQGSGDDR